MGGSYFSRDDYKARTTARHAAAASKGISHKSATFAYDHGIKSGAIKAKVHTSLNPLNANRESRDSDAHPVTVPIMITLDTTGSMGRVPEIIQDKLPHLMGCFLDDKVSGKKYLGEGYPAICISAVDDFNAIAGGSGALQVGQFESGIEIDDNLTNLWLTGQGGSTYEENYELAIYFAARHTAHDHWEKRRRKGYLFIIGDEHPYETVSKNSVRVLIGDSLQEDVPLKAILREAQERYHVFYILPNMTNHYHDERLFKYWVALLGQQQVLRLEEPEKICELIVGAVALCEQHVGIDDLGGDLSWDGARNALVTLASVSGAGVSTHSGDSLAPIPGASSGVTRL